MKSKKPASPEYSHWRIATSMQRLSSDFKSGINDKSDPYAFGQFISDNYDDLIDHPIQMGHFEVVQFEACNVPHEIVVTGFHTGHLERLSSDCQSICEHHIRFFGEPAPMSRYVFLLNLVGEGYGGLEHRSSTALLASREYLPKKDAITVSEGYSRLLGLFSHEYFHTWNIKRIKPAAFSPYDLTQENYTKQLWIFEGITSFYDDLALIRSKRIELQTYLEILGRVITDVWSHPGRLKQTLEQSSLEAWSKFYNPDENSLNLCISYYTKGSLVALALDLLIRRETQNRFSLDTIMKKVWKDYGILDKGLPEGAFEDLCIKTTGVDLKPFFDLALRSTDDLPLVELFKTVGINCQFNPKFSMDDKGGKKTVENPQLFENRSVLEVLFKQSHPEAHVAHVLSGSSAEAAGIAAHDVLIAINGIKVDRLRFESMITNYAVGDEITIHGFRRDELMTYKVKLRAPENNACVLSLIEDRSISQQKILDHWIGGSVIAKESN